MYAFVDRERHYFIRVGSYTIHRAPSLQIILDPPRMEERYVPEHPTFSKVYDSFMRAAETYGGDLAAINLLKEHYNMLKNKIFIVSLLAIASADVIVNIVGTANKAKEVIGTDENLKAVKTAEEFAALPEATRLLIAGLDEKVATLDAATQLERAFEVLGKYEMPAKQIVPRSRGVKSLIRDIFAIEGAKHTVAEIMEITGGTEVSVKTALSDLRSATYCKPGEPISLYRTETGHYMIVDKAALEAEKTAKAEAKEKEKAEKKAKADEAKKAKEDAKAKKAAETAAAGGTTEAKPKKGAKKAAAAEETPPAA